jgi:hypothetical protein
MLHQLEVYDDNCSICMEKLKSNRKPVLVLECNHACHHDCIIQWIKKSSICPMCRAPIHISLDLYGNMQQWRPYVEIEVNGSFYGIDTDWDILTQVCRAFDEELKKAAPIFPSIFSWLEPDVIIRIRSLNIDIRRTESPWNYRWSCFGHGAAIGAVLVLSIHAMNSIRKYMS